MRGQETTSTENEYLSAAEAARRLSLHPNTIVRYIKDGKLRGIRVGKQYRIHEDDLTAFLQTFSEDSTRSDASILTVANQKGGVGKTTTAVNLAAALGAHHGKRVLLIDLDPQGACSLSVGLDTFDLPKTVYNVMIESSTTLASVIKPTEHGFDLAPSNIDLAAAELRLTEMLAREFILRRKLDPILSRYDYVIIDTPPTLGMLTINALAAADAVLIPLACHYMALRGLDTLLGTIDQIRGSLNARLTLLGILPTQFDSRTIHSREVLQYLEQFCQDHSLPLFRACIKQSVRFHEAPNEQRPLVLLHPDHGGAHAYDELAKEVVYGTA